MNWKQTTLGEISSNIQTGPFGSQLHQSDYSENGIPVVMPKDILNGHVSDISIARVPEEYANRLNRHKIEPGDILYSRRGDVGRCAFTTDIEAGWLCGTGCLRVTINQRKAIPKFVFYQLQKTETIGWVEKHAVGSTMLNLNTSILSNVPIQIPSIDKQRFIVGVLSAYDNLIENNQKQIKLLEEAAQRLYKEWFVDLRFPGHENTKITDGIPEGWEYKPIFDVFDFVRGRSYTSNELSDSTGVLMVNLKNIRAFGGYNRNAEKRFVGQFKDNQILSAGDVIMGVTDMTQERRLVGHVALVPNMGETMIFSMDLIKLIPKRTDNLFLYSAMIFGGVSKRISPLANGVNVLHLKPEAIMGVEMLIPNDKVVCQYHSQMAPVFSEIETLQKQCDIAAEARDRLLSKLMNGEKRGG